MEARHSQKKESKIMIIFMRLATVVEIYLQLCLLTIGSLDQRESLDSRL